jgi:hypothetical protein
MAKSFGDAMIVDLTTRTIRCLTCDVPGAAFPCVMHLVTGMSEGAAISKKNSEDWVFTSGGPVAGSCARKPHGWRWRTWIFQAAYPGSST